MATVAWSELEAYSCSEELSAASQPARSPARPLAFPLPWTKTVILLLKNGSDAFSSLYLEHEVISYPLSGENIPATPGDRAARRLLLFLLEANTGVAELFGILQHPYQVFWSSKATVGCPAAVQAEV